MVSEPRFEELTLPAEVVRYTKLVHQYRALARPNSIRVAPRSFLSSRFAHGRSRAPRSRRVRTATSSSRDGPRRRNDDDPHDHVVRDSGRRGVRRREVA
jgi:hypothetical protein